MTNLNNAFNDRENTMMDLVGQTFLRNSRWLMVIGWFKMILFLAVAAFAAFRFFQTDATRALIGWATVFIVCTLSTGFMFVLYWLDLNRNAVQREIKRLELRIAELQANKLTTPPAA